MVSATIWESMSLAHGKAISFPHSLYNARSVPGLVSQERTWLRVLGFFNPPALAQLAQTCRRQVLARRTKRDHIHRL